MTRGGRIAGMALCLVTLACGGPSHGVPEPEGPEVSEAAAPEEARTPASSASADGGAGACTPGCGFGFECQEGRCIVVRVACQEERGCESPYECRDNVCGLPGGERCLSALQCQSSRCMNGYCTYRLFRSF
ncbi:hypothetical protein ACLESO_29565 [Pyxidicoccus sp. 3LG]